MRGWYAAFLQNLVLPNAAVWSFVVAWGETLVGIALILDLFTGIAAFFGSFMNANYILAGSVSMNPILFAIATWLVLAYSGLVGPGPVGIAGPGHTMEARVCVSPRRQRE